MNYFYRRQFPPNKVFQYKFQGSNSRSRTRKFLFFYASHFMLSYYVAQKGLEISSLLQTPSFVENVRAVHLNDKSFIFSSLPIFTS